MNRIFIAGLACWVFFSGVVAQEPSAKWDLKRCIEYAAKNNISVKQADVQARLSRLDVDKAKWAQYPNLGFSTNLGTQWGRSIDPTTNLFTTTQLLFQSATLSTGAQIFNWGALQSDKKIAAFNAQAAATDVERITNDISLNIATYFLQVVAAKQQIEIAEVQLEQTKFQLGFTRKKVDAGTLPELSAAEIEAQLARDTTTLVNAQASFSQALIQLKAAISIDMATPFEVEIPAVESISLAPLADLEPTGLYQIALNAQPLQKVNTFKLRAADESVKRARSAFYPTFSAFGSLGSNFANSATEITGANVLGSKPTTNFVTVNNVNYQVYQPDIQILSQKRSFGGMWSGWGTQMDQNFRQSVGLQLTVPIFSNGSAKLGYQRAKLNLQTTENNKQQADLTLQQNIYQSFTNARAAMLRYNASQKSVEASQKAYDFAAKRYEAGLSNTLDLITNQNNLLKAKLDRLNNQFDYIFRIKLLEFYKGQGIKL